eukprot:4957260-Pyramimonas_sp.AAC.1
MQQNNAQCVIIQPVLLAGCVRNESIIYTAFGPQFARGVTAMKTHRIRGVANQGPGPTGRGYNYI